MIKSKSKEKKNSSQSINLNDNHSHLDPLKIILDNTCSGWYSIYMNKKKIENMSKMLKSLMKAIDQTPDEKLTEIQKDTLFLAMIKERNYTPIRQNENENHSH